MPGLPNTRVIPHGWEGHHRPVSEGGMEAVCRIDRPSDTGTWDDTLGRDIPDLPMLVYQGRCRFHGTAPAGTQTVADKQVARGQYTVTIPAAAAEVVKNDVVTILVCAGDPASVGKVLQVMGASRSAQTWERTLTVQMPQPTTSP